MTAFNCRLCRNFSRNGTEFDREQCAYGCKNYDFDSRTDTCQNYTPEVSKCTCGTHAEANGLHEAYCALFFKVGETK